MAFRSDKERYLLIKLLNIKQDIMRENSQSLDSPEQKRELEAILDIIQQIEQ